ncbi:class I SAM-dependent methyltransferase [Roseibium sp.]|uniref:class I SAM-dependent methyltransferase n=1 Tax=Roseibium sp. TaxID=1936156 RepID=UPI003BA97260
MNISDLYAQQRQVDDFENCDFYHTIDLSPQETVWGHVDLRGREQDYLGGCDLDGKSVLEVGPATGHLAFYMEQQGAAVTCLELPDTDVGDLVPRADLENWDQIIADRRRHLDRIVNGFWYCHRKLGSKTNVVYGTVEDLIAAGAKFDIVILGGVLLHLRDLQLRLQQFAGLAQSELVITEQLLAPLDRSDTAPLVWLAPTKGNGVWDHWWRFGPGYFTGYLPILGFSDLKVSKHEQSCLGNMFMHFTIRARRNI